MTKMFRSEQRTDRIYLYVDEHGDEVVFTTPDGEGRHYWDTLEEAEAEYDYPVELLDEEPSDF